MLDTPDDDDWREEFRICHPELGERWLAGRGRMTRDNTGHGILLAGIDFDITDRKRTEQELADARQFFSSTINALTSHIAVLDENGVILAVNSAWQRFADANQYRGQDYGVGSNYIEHCEPASAGCDEGRLVAEGLKAMLRGDSRQFQLEYSCHSPTQPRWFILRATRFGARGPARVVVNHDDITERKLAEEAVQEADRRKSEFLAMLGHELRNPLAPISSAVELLKVTAYDAESVASVSRMIERQVGHLSRLVDDLLDVSRISRGRIELKKERIELASVVRHAVEDALPLTKASCQELTVGLPVEPIYLDADPARLAQVIGNLLSNARKYSEPGGYIRLTVERHGSIAVVKIQDTGIGLAADQVVRIFEMFSQVDSKSPRSQSGLGIGLNLVKKITEMHGGNVEARSDGPGRGSEFTVRLPIVSKMPHLLPKSKTQNANGPMPSRRVLIVDDNVDAADGRAMLLTEGGHEVHSVYDGLAALEAPNISPGAYPPRLRVARARRL
jgi:signal transduction histidine kinase